LPVIPVISVLFEETLVTWNRERQGACHRAALNDDLSWSISWVFRGKRKPRTISHPQSHTWNGSYNCIQTLLHHPKLEVLVRFASRIYVYSAANGNGLPSDPSSVLTLLSSSICPGTAEKKIQNCLTYREPARQLDLWDSEHVWLQTYALNWNLSPALANIVAIRKPLFGQLWLWFCNRTLLEQLHA
jgi:hypothetical protein